MKALPCVLCVVLATVLSASPSAQDSAPAPAKLRVRHELPIEGKPLGLASFDLDGDEVSELFAISTSPSALHIFDEFEVGVGVRQAPTVIPIGDYPVGPIVSSGEIVVGSRSRKELHWFNAKSLTSKTARLGMVLPTAPRVLVSGDVDRDGREEVCILTKENEILLAGYDGSLEKTFTGHDQPCCAWPLADGRLVIGFQVGKEVCVYRRDESEKAGWAIDWQVVFDGIPRAIREVDVDGNGDLELVVSGGDRSHWVLGLGGEGGTRDWIEPAEVRPSRVEWGAIPYGLDSAQAGEFVSLAYFESGWGRFGGSNPKRLESGYAGQTPVAIAAADFDGDGHSDLAIANAEAQRVSLMFGEASGKLRVAPQARTGRAPTALVAVDVDGDGKSEAVSLNALDNTFSVVRWEGSKLRRIKLGESGSEASTLAAGNLNAGPTAIALTILRQTSGQGMLSVNFGGKQPPHFETMGGNGAEPVNGDFKAGKSASDVLIFAATETNAARICVADALGNALHIFGKDESNNENPLPYAPKLKQTLALSSAPCALASLDAKSTRLAVALAGPGERTGVSIVSTTGSLQELEFIPLTETPLDICSGDFDGDGRLDIGVLAYQGNRDGLGFFIPLLTRDKGFIPGPKQRTGLRAHSIVSGDLNGDGRDDVLVSAQNSHHVNLWLSGSGAPVSFARQADLGLETGPLGLALGDANGDGRLDIFVANAFSNSVSVVLNETE